MGGKMSFWRRFFPQADSPSEARTLFAILAERARDPIFYQYFRVPDTIDGRFEMLSIHAFLLFRRLKEEGKAGRRLAQSVYDEMFKAMDLELRELGAADIGVGRRVKIMAEGLNGRILAYEKALTESAGEIERAIQRNVFGTVESVPEHVAALAVYLKTAHEFLIEKDMEDIMDVAAGKRDSATLFPGILQGNEEGKVSR